MRRCFKKYGISTLAEIAETAAVLIPVMTSPSMTYRVKKYVIPLAAWVHLIRLAVSCRVNV